MKLHYLTVLTILCLLLNTSKILSQTASTNVIYSGFQACGGCTVCGADYWCIGIHGSYCGDIPNCDTRTFFDPVPAGNVVTNVTMNYWAASCAGAAIFGSINGFSVPVAYDGNTGCWCDANPCGLTSSASQNFPCGLPGYVYGGTNSLQICVGTGEYDPSVCFSRIELVFTYVAPDVINPSITPLGPTSFCPGGSVVLDAGSGYPSYIWNTGASTQSITASSTGTYTVTVTSITGCTSGTSSVNVNVLSPPTPNITGPTSYCAGTSTTLNAGAYSSYIWSTGASSQTISVTDANNPITVTVTDGNGCSGTSPAVFVSPLSLPTPSITGPLSYCAGGGTTLDAGGPYSAYYWSNGGNAQSTTVTAANNPVSVTVTDGNGCTGTSAGVYVTENTLPTPVVTGSLTYCPTSSASLDAGVYSSYYWSTGATSQTTTATSVNNPITVTVTDANGCTGVSPSVNVSEAASLNPVITGSTTYCSGSSTTLNAGAYASFIWSTGATTQTIQATAADNPIYVTVTDAGGCFGSSAGVSVFATEPPSPSVNGNSSYCQGSSAVLSTGIYSSYLWSNGSNMQTATVTIADNPVSVVVTDANGCTGTSLAVTLNEMASPSPVINGTLTYCNGYSSTLNTGSYSAYLWSTGAITQTINATVADNPISVTVTDANGCTGVSAPVNVSLAGNITPTITGTLSYCPGSSTTLSTGIYSSYLWSTGATTQYTTATIANNPVTVTVTDVSGCTGTATANVILSTPPNPSIIGTLVYCSSSSTTLTTGSYSSYYWSTGAITQSVTVTAANNPISVTVTDANGCTGSATTSVSPYTVTSSVISLTDVDCFSNSTGAVSVLPSGGVTPYTYLWSNGNTTNSINDLAAGSYTVTITDNNSCQGVSTYTIGQPPVLSVSETVSPISCNGQDNGMILANASGGTPPYQYLWPDSSTGPSIGSLQAGTYSFTVTDANDCVDSVLNIILTDPPILRPSTSSDNPTCYGGNDGTASVTVTGGVPPYSYAWTGGFSVPTITNLTSGIYIVTITDLNFCTATQIVTLYNPSAIVSVDSVTIDQSNHGNIDITVTGGTLPYAYIWSNGATTEDISGLSSGIYIVTITDINTCNATDSVLLDIPYLPLLIPNVITPNNDGVNDDFEIKNIEQYKNVSIQIFNQWGNVLFVFSGTCQQYKNPENRWDGTYNGKDLPTGSYVYIILIDDLDPFTGVCSIIR